MINPFLHLDQGILARLRITPGLERGSSGTQNDRRTHDLGADDRNVAGVVAGNLLLLVRQVMLFIDDDETQVFCRRENSRARADDDPCFATTDAIPLLRPFVGSERRVQQRHTVTERAVQLCRHGGRETDFGHQQNGRAAGQPRALHGGEIHGCLARTGYAMQQAGAKFFSVERRRDLIERCLLFSIEHVLRLRPGCGRKMKRCRALFDAHQTALYQRLQCARGNLQPAQNGDGKGSAGSG